MNFYVFSTFLTVALTNDINIVKSGLFSPSICKIGLEFYTELNNTSSEDSLVELVPDECCLVGDVDDCSSVQIVGDCSEVIPSGSKKFMSLVAPLLDPFERVGFCSVHIDSRPVDRKRGINRETLTIPFDTRIKNEDYSNTDNKDTIFSENRFIDEVLSHCENIDEDPLNKCRPVNCETYYNGKKSYFDKIAKRCAQIPICLNKTIVNLKQVYNPNTNKCVNFTPIADQDIEFIKTVAKRSRHPKDILLIRSGMDTSLTDKHIATAINSSLLNSTKLKVPYQSLYKAATKYLTRNRYTVVVLCLVIIVQCFVIVSMIYCLTNSSSCCNRKKVFCKFFNYRQDASVTTPLIGTSNDYTETTEFDYVSESSNIDKKIRCYKACQKDNAQISMSDDILSKCLNRRAWRPITVKNTETEIKEYLLHGKQPVLENKTEYNRPAGKHNDEELKQDIIDDDKSKSNETSIKNDNILQEGTHGYHSDSALSETEINCFNYNFQHTTELKQIGIKNKSSSVSSENPQIGAQAQFSNDSIDDFLSERGIQFGENTSKLSFRSSSSPQKSSLSNLTSKTSKNNILQNVLSFLKKKKCGPSSEPGVIKSKSKDLELIHISSKTYSSSSEMKLNKNVEKVKESRTSF